MELVQSRTPAAADSALAGLQGGIGQAVGIMREDCIDLLAELEVHTLGHDDQHALRMP